MSANVAIGKVNSKLDARAGTCGGALCKTDDGKAHITINPLVLNMNSPGVGGSSDDLSVTFIHESMHLQPGEEAMRPQSELNNPQWQKDHHNPYENADDELWCNK